MKRNVKTLYSLDYRDIETKQTIKARQSPFTSLRKDSVFEPSGTVDIGFRSAALNNTPGVSGLKMRRNTFSPVP